MARKRTLMVQEQTLMASLGFLEQTPTGQKEIVDGLKQTRDGQIQITDDQGKTVKGPTEEWP